LFIGHGSLLVIVYHGKLFDKVQKLGEFFRCLFILRGNPP
jgi:hypothetical protein